MRNAFYGLRLATLLQPRGVRRLLAAQLVIDESSAMTVIRDDQRSARLAFWATGWSVFTLWNAPPSSAPSVPAPSTTLVLGLDAAATVVLGLRVPSSGGRS